MTVTELRARRAETEQALTGLAERIEGMLPDLGGSLAADLLRHAFGQVEWFEVVDAIRSES